MWLTKFVLQSNLPIVIALALIVCCTRPAMAQQSGQVAGKGDNAPYLLVDLLGLPVFDASGTFFQSRALSINEPDSATVQVVGFAYSGQTGPPQGANRTPTLWEVDADGFFTIKDLGLPPDAREATATDVNDWGVITIDTLQSDTLVLPAWVSVPGLPLQKLPFQGNAAETRALNNFVEIVGLHADNQGANWKLDDKGAPSIPTSLGKEGAGGFIPSDVADSGLMAGHLDLRPAIAWLDPDGVLQMQRLDPSRTAFPGIATAISKDGRWVVGWVAPSGAGTETAFRWSAATGITLLGLVGGDTSIALGVNNAGQVVGRSDTNDRRHPQTAFLWQDGQMFDLNTLISAGRKVQLLQATAINNAGHIVGELRLYEKGKTELHAFALLPNSP